MHKIYEKKNSASGKAVRMCSTHISRSDSKGLPGRTWYVFSLLLRMSGEVKGAALDSQRSFKVSSQAWISKKTRHICVQVTAWPGLFSSDLSQYISTVNPFWPENDSQKFYVSVSVVLNISSCQGP